jgi:hypothetical protein
VTFGTLRRKADHRSGAFAGGVDIESLKAAVTDQTRGDREGTRAVSDFDTF